MIRVLLAKPYDLLSKKTREIYSKCQPDLMILCQLWRSLKQTVYVVSYCLRQVKKRQLG